jgi:hypothetical protein
MEVIYYVQAYRRNGILPLTAPVNHNMLNETIKTLQIVNTILGNAYQDKQEGTRQNENFGLDACVIVGFDNMTELGDSAQNLPKFQIPYLTPKSVKTC